MTIEQELRIIGDFVAEVEEGDNEAGERMLELIRATLDGAGYEKIYNAFRDASEFMSEEQ